MSEHDEEQAEAVETPADDACIEMEIMAGFAKDDRAMIRTLGTLIEATAKARSEESPPRVSYAMGDMMIAACERIARICRADDAISAGLPDYEESPG